MKRLLVFLFIFTFCMQSVFAALDKTSEAYLKSVKKPFTMSFIGENIVESALKHALKKEAPGRYKVKFKGYTLTSIKHGIFKYLEVTGKNVNANEIEIPYFNVKTVTDYNWVDYNKNPIEFKSDMELDCLVHLSEKTINDALETEEYNKVLRHVNKKAYPMFTLNKVSVKINDNTLHITMSYNFPLAPKTKDRTFEVSSKLKVVNNDIKLCDVHFDSKYGNLPVQKVANLVNMINPLSLVAKMIDRKNAEDKIEDIKIEDDIVIINGKIYIKGVK